MRDIHGPKDIGFVDTFSGEDCEKEQYYNNCYHCWSTALAKRKAYWEMPVQEDCISREHLLEEIASLKESPWFKDDTNCAMAIRKEAIEIVEDLCIRKEPSVNSQEPCEDCISRKRLKECFHKNVVGSKVFDELIDMQPSVNPQKIGHWIYDRTRDWDGECNYECSECGMGSDVDYAYCMRCGARMKGDAE